MADRAIRSDSEGLGAFGRAPHAGIRSRIDDSGDLVHEGYCSCRHVTDPHAGPHGKARAGAELATHLHTCPDEGLVVDVSYETEAWAADHYPDQTCTLDEWREFYA